MCGQRGRTDIYKIVEKRLIEISLSETGFSYFLYPWFCTGRNKLKEVVPHAKSRPVQNLTKVLPGSADMKLTEVRWEMGQILVLQIYWGLKHIRLRKSEISDSISVKQTMCSSFAGHLLKAMVETVYKPARPLFWSVWLFFYGHNPWSLFVCFNIINMCLIITYPLCQAVAHPQIKWVCVLCNYSSIGKWSNSFFLITEFIDYLKVKGTHKDHWVLLLAPHSNT